MADFNPSLTGPSQEEATLAGLPQGGQSAVDWGQQFVQNQLKTQQQQQLIENAKQVLAQNALKTQQEEEAAGQGYNPQLINTVPKQVAADEVTMAIDRQGLMTDEVKADLSKWVADLPDLVSRQEVDAQISKYQPKNPTRVAQGQSYQATQQMINSGKTDEEGNALVLGQWYVDSEDSEGNVHTLNTGKPASEVNAETKANVAPKSNADERQNARLFNAALQKMTPFLTTSRSGLGAAVTAYTRAERALDLLQGTQGQLTNSEIHMIATDIDGIMRGGVASDAGTDESTLRSVVSDLNSWASYWSNTVITKLPVVGSYAQHIGERLTGELNTLIGSSKLALIQGLTAAFGGLQFIGDNAEHWENIASAMPNRIMDTLEAAKNAKDGKVSPQALMQIMKGTTPPSGLVQTQAGPVGAATIPAPANVAPAPVNPPAPKSEAFDPDEYLKQEEE